MKILEFNETLNLSDEKIKPIYIKIKIIDQNGLVTFEFSEDLISLLERNDSRLNLDSISNYNFLKIYYTTLYTGNKDDDDKSSTQQINLPKLEGWKFEEFTSKGCKVRLNFSNPLLVSQSPLGKDNIVFVFLVPELFQSKKTMQILEKNYTLSRDVPT